MSTATDVALSENRVVRALGALRAEGRKGLMPFVCGGHPNLKTTRDVLPALARAGASVVEVGFPFSDPIADGRTISAAMHKALIAGVTPRGIFESVHEARESGKIDDLGIVAMVSVSIVWKMGIERFVSEAKDAGFDGFIFPDAPVEVSGELLGPVREAGLVASLLVAPTTPKERLSKIAEACSGFVYLLARMGITGERSIRAGDVPKGWPTIPERVAALREHTDLPIACGFGISTPEDVRAIVSGGGADAAIVGSALVKRMDRAAGQGGDPVGAAETLIRSLRVGLD